MPQFDLSTFPSQIIWLALSFIVLYILMARVALPRVGTVMAEREEKIDDNLSAAEDLRASAKADAEAYDRALAAAREEARTAIQEAARAVSVEAAAKQDALAQRLAQQIKTAEAEIERAKAGARASIREAAVGVAQAATQRLIGVAPSEGETAAAVDKALQGRGA
jgi:F-type H+-transporting ATPase subunit b